MIWGFGRSRWRDGRYRVFAGRLFLSYNIRFLSDNRPRFAVRTLVDDLASGTPGRSNGETAIENP